MNGRSTYSDRTAALLACSCALFAGIAGCAGMDTAESQLFAERSRCSSAAITYRVQQQTGRGNAPRSAVAKLLNPGAAPAQAERRVMTLAVRYPHPAGRAGYARVECITADAQNGDVAPAPRGWLRRIGRLADDTLPGLKMAEGVHEALGLDVPIGELEDMLAKLQQPRAAGEVAGSRAGGAAATELTCTINNCALPARRTRVAELDRLVARVRRDGSIISHSSGAVEPIGEPAAEMLSVAVSVPPASAQTVAETPVAREDAPAAVQHDAAVLPVGYTQPTTWRLPPVDNVLP